MGMATDVSRRMDDSCVGRMARRGSWGTKLVRGIGRQLGKNLFNPEIESRFNEGSAQIVCSAWSKSPRFGESISSSTTLRSPFINSCGSREPYVFQAAPQSRRLLKFVKRFSASMISWKKHSPLLRIVSALTYGRIVHKGERRRSPNRRVLSLWRSRRQSWKK